jgi:outer membrane protein OmpA-like peptidoglycan-associated protein
MILKKQILLALFLAFTFTTYSQTSEITKIDSTRVSSWVFGLGFNAVDDSGNAFGKLFDIKKAWNAVPYPSRLSIGKYFKSGLGIEGILAYNKYKEGKIVDNFPLTNDKDYFSIDSRLSYDLNKIIGETGWFDPYIGVGVGFTHANDFSRGTYNGVLGFRTWFSDRIGLDINTSGKWAMNSNFKNHLQHAIGLVYKFNIDKDLSKKEQGKLDLIEQLEKVNIRVKDSINQVNKDQEKALYEAQKLAQEKEKVRLVQLEKEKAETRNKIQRKIDNLENLYFPFDSSSLTFSSKTILDKLILILNEHPKLSIEITSHTDSRGKAIYNQKLSEKRLKSTLDYLIEKDLKSDRVTGKAFGEEKLVNECDDHTMCSEVRHKQNRRSEISILDF